MTRFITLLTFYLSSIIFVDAIIIRDDVKDSEYRAKESEWPSVFPLDAANKLRKGECAATLIADRYAITAAHCFGKNIKQFRAKIAGETYNVIKVHRNPCFSIRKDGPDGADIAVMKLDRSPPLNVPRIPVYKWKDEEGQRMVLMGWGDTGTAGIRPGQTKTDRKFRVAENIVTKATTDKGEKSMLFYKLDKNGLPLEGMAWSGDSGGPMFLTNNGQTYIAGTNSAGDCCKYGSIDGYSRLSVKYNWIETTMKNDSPAQFNCQTLNDDSSPNPPPPPPPPTPTPPSLTRPPTRAPNRPPSLRPTRAPTNPPPTPRPPTRAPTNPPPTPQPPTRAPTQPQRPNDDDDDDDDDYYDYYDSCSDDETFKFQNNPKKNCKWVKKKKRNQRCRKNWKGKPVWQYCPVTCNKC